MKRSRGLWVTVVIVAVVTALSVAALASGRLQPVLGLDLKGGVSVILSAPDGTPSDTMQQALENIRNRVDAFGVGEPDIALSGNTIEVQIPGLSDSTVQQRSVDLQCIADPKGATYGCASDAKAPTTALQGFEVTSKDTKVCIYAGSDQLQCFESQSAADAAKKGITPAPKTSTSASASASAPASTSETPSPSPTTSQGPGSKLGEYCLTDISNTELQCYTDYAAAQAAFKSLTTKVAQTSWCISAPARPRARDRVGDADHRRPPGSRSRLRRRAPPGGTGRRATPSASPTGPATTPAETAYASLDTSGSSPLPCDYKTKQEAQTGLDALTVQHITTRYCVVSSQGAGTSGATRRRTPPTERQRETGQESLIELIGQTARLEERPTLAILTPADPVSVDHADVPAGPNSATQGLPGRGERRNGRLVPGPEQSDAVHLGPVVDHRRQHHERHRGAQRVRPVGRRVAGRLRARQRGHGRSSRRDPPRRHRADRPMNQIAIAVDRKIISNPVVQAPITAGRGRSPATSPSRARRTSPRSSTRARCP